MDSATLDTLLYLGGTAVILPIVGILKRFTDQTWLAPYVRWEVFAALGLILMAWQFSVWFAPLMTAKEIIDLGLKSAGACSIAWGIGKTVQAVTNKNNHSERNK
jgi:hypothetical protein